jgi:hypothetical protein
MILKLTGKPEVLLRAKSIDETSGFFVHKMSKIGWFYSER